MNQKKRIKAVIKYWKSGDLKDLRPIARENERQRRKDTRRFYRVNGKPEKKWLRLNLKIDF